jgi:hypothetical protein
VQSNTAVGGNVIAQAGPLSSRIREYTSLQVPRDVDHNDFMRADCGKAFRYVGNLDIDDAHRGVWFHTKENKNDTKKESGSGVNKKPYYINVSGNQSRGLALQSRNDVMIATPFLKVRYAQLFPHGTYEHQSNFAKNDVRTECKSSMGLCDDAWQASTTTEEGHCSAAGQFAVSLDSFRSKLVDFLTDDPRTMMDAKQQWLKRGGGAPPADGVGESARRNWIRDRMDQRVRAVYKTRDGDDMAMNNGTSNGEDGEEQDTSDRTLLFKFDRPLYRNVAKQVPRKHLGREFQAELQPSEEGKAVADSLFDDYVDYGKQRNVIRVQDSVSGRVFDYNTCPNIPSGSIVSVIFRLSVTPGAPGSDGFETWGLKCEPSVIHWWGTIRQQTDDDRQQLCFMEAMW